MDALRTADELAAAPMRLVQSARHIDGLQLDRKAAESTGADGGSRHEGFPTIENKRRSGETFAGDPDFGDQGGAHYGGGASGRGKQNRMHTGGEDRNGACRAGGDSRGGAGGCGGDEDWGGCDGRSEASATWALVELEFFGAAALGA
eukprot:5679311-Pleurochrysis_carterae.AAC.1